ncbi:putative flippase GtrA [Phenylobacterium haematophilum]|uniref:Putative flippase GtrA n=1 Tax=Phenylobacterium haematophilum TaxID=98513 RepID=A0A839ZU49_9CAUL|nr:GtrA family protein [Phenylobacterium haematophilum]MBB3889514.1 putative flippase GtrA [Phenylobacterium haematophilum]
MASIDEHVLTAGPGWKPLGFDVLRFARFLTVGGLAAGTNFTSRFAWSLVLPFEAAVICAYATGMAVAFVLFRLLVFPGSPLPIGVQARNFAIVNAIGATLTFLTATLLVRGVFPAIGFTWHAETIGHALAIVVPVATSWIGHRRFTFARAG